MQNTNIQIIDYPFKTSEVPFFIKTKGHFEFRITDKLDSKKIYAHKKRNKKTFLILEISNNQIDRFFTTRNLYIFTTPADFYIDTSKETNFYRECTKRLIDGNYNEIINISEMICDFTLSSSLPPYLPPILSCVNTGKGNMLLKTNFNKKMRYGVIKVSISEDVPLCPSIQVEESYKLAFDEKQKDDIQAFFSSIKDPVLNQRSILGKSKTFKSKNSTTISKYIIKEALPYFRYFFKDGPWRNTWVKYGYDPKLSWDNYKYQVCDRRTKHQYFQLFETEYIIEEVEKNRSWYLKTTFDYKTGYFKETLYNLISYHIYLNFSSKEQNDELTYEIPDI